MKCHVLIPHQWYYYTWTGMGSKRNNLKNKIHPKTVKESKATTKGRDSGATTNSIRKQQATEPDSSNLGYLRSRVISVYKKKTSSDLVQISTQCFKNFRPTSLRVLWETKVTDQAIHHILIWTSQVNKGAGVIRSLILVVLVPVLPTYFTL